MGLHHNTPNWQSCNSGQRFLDTWLGYGGEADLNLLTIPPVPAKLGKMVRLVKGVLIARAAPHEHQHGPFPFYRHSTAQTLLESLLRQFHYPRVATKVVAATDFYTWTPPQSGLYRGGDVASHMAGGRQQESQNRHSSHPPGSESVNPVGDRWVGEFQMRWLDREFPNTVANQLDSFRERSQSRWVAGAVSYEENPLIASWGITLARHSHPSST